MHDFESFEPEDYISERISLAANDGIILPATIVYNKKMIKPSKNIALLHTYGSALDAQNRFSFDPMMLSLMDRGFMWVLPHIRGTIDLATDWYRAGTGELKTRHFQDFLDITTSLVAEDIAEEICAWGEGYSGGLTVASVLTKEPCIYSSVVISNPLLDVVEYLLDKRDTQEFGSFTENFDTINSYSPYQHPHSGDISQLLVSTDTESPVATQALKYVAKLRNSCKSSTNMILYKEYPTWVQKELRRADEMAFIIGSVRDRLRDSNYKSS